MARLQLTYYGNSILRKKAAPIVEITDEIKKLAADMIETMDIVNCIGLAAPQVGQSVRLFVLRNYIISEDGAWKVSPPVVYINPEIRIIGDRTWVDEEGCGSIPGIRVDVERPYHIEISATDLSGNPFHEALEGLNGRVRLHENDHINGVLMIDRIDKNKKKQLEPFLHRIKKKFNPS